MRYLLLLIISFSISLTGFSQIGNLLKKAAKTVLENDKIRDQLTDKVSEEMAEMRSEYDSSSFNYAIALSDNAGLFESKEKFERHKKFLIEGFNKKYNETSDLDQAKGWIDRAEILYANGKYKLAAGLLISALAVYETEGATDNIDYAKALANLGLVAHSGGRYTYSMEFTQKSMDLRKNLFGDESKGFAASLNNYALLLKDLGQYNESEEVLIKASDLNKQVHGEESIEYAITLNNLGVLSQAFGRYEDSEEYFISALQISESHLKEKSANYQQLQTNLALLYQETERYTEAEEIYLNAIDIRKRRLGTGHPDYAHMLVNLASLYMDMEKYDLVEENLVEARDIYISKLGENNPRTAGAISDLGNFYLFKEKYDDALPLLIQSKNIRKETLGTDHPGYVQSLEDLAILFNKIDRADRAMELYTEVMAKTMNFIDEYFLPMSENEKSKIWGKMQPRFQRFYSFCLDNHEMNKNLLTQMFNYHLATKAILLNSSNKIREDILSGSNEELKNSYYLWLDQKESLAKYYTYSKEQIADENINIDSLENAANKTERYLSENSQEFGSQMTREKVTFNDLIKALDVDEAAVEMIRVNYFNNTFSNNIKYVGLIAKKDAEIPEFVQIENGQDLESKYFRYYNNVIKQKMNDEYSYSFFWEPIDKKLNQTQHAYISVDGVYNQINIATLKDSQGKFQIDKLDITLLGNTKDLLKIKSAESKKETKSAALFGYPIYGGDGSIKMLPGTQKEVETVQNILNSNFSIKKYTETSASEENLKEIEKPSVLHIATHGFFLEDVSKNENKVFGIQAEKARENPLLRSGLLFTDAGKTALGDVGSSLSGSNNGVLTAYEAMALPLNYTELVVLSACETGLGDVRAGEGVYGLQRSFLIAGADAMIMSLWKVDDTATQKLMSSFYKSWISGISIEKAFSSAQKKIKKEYPHPYYWGGFVLVRKE